MGIVVRKDKDKVYFEGKGGEFLRLKAFLTKELSSGSWQHEGKGLISIQIGSISYLMNHFSALSIELPTSIMNECKPSIILHEEHVNAKITISDILDTQKCSTDVPYWDSILDEQQGLAVNAMTCHGLLGMCLFDEQGSGKTVMSIAAFDILYDRAEVESLLVVCPKSMISEWPNEFGRFTSDKYPIMTLEGDSQEKISRIYSHPTVLVMNFESVKPNIELLKAYAKSKKSMLIVDESFYVKNADSVRSASVFELRKECTRALCLCGTPAPNSPQDIIHQFNVADGGYTFEGFDVIEHGNNIEKVMDRISARGVFIRRLKQELLPELPEKEFTIHRVPLTGRQLSLYNNAKEALLIYLRNLDNQRFSRHLTTYFQRRAALLQICTDPSAFDPQYHDTPAKYSTLDDIVNETVNINHRKIVIWSFYRHSLDSISNRYSHLGLVRIDGTILSATERREAVCRFQNDSETRVFIGNPAAAGAGITLHAASDAVYLSYSNQAAHFLQSLDRIHRRGQFAPSVNYHMLICKNTIEENEVRRLREKEKAQHELLQDDVTWPVSIDEAIKELQRDQI